jgi:hypothetical protein
MSDDLQSRIVAIGIDVFGEQNVRDPRERLLRFFEEAVELVRAGGMSRKTMEAMLDREFSRPQPGVFRKELGGAACTLMAVANAHGYCLLNEAELEISRVQQNKERARQSHKSKPDNIKAGEIQ